MGTPCIFCEIVAGREPSYRVLEDDIHLAILDINPTVDGQTVVLTKSHRPSYVFEMDRDEYGAFCNLPGT